MALQAILSAGLICAGLLALPCDGEAQAGSVRGQASLGGATSSSTEAQRELRFRYQPEWSAAKALSPTLTLDAMAAANLWASTVSPGSGASRSDNGARPYRAWVRLSAPRLEVRAGLQKIAFGSANVFRPLMWFDQVDPRDPLQLSEGVWGVLTRAYLPGNVTAWIWGIVGKEERKGWEVIPTEEGATEGGGRLEIPIGSGEVAATYHRRRFDLAPLGVVTPGSPATGSEDRFAFDGRWDLDFGLWLEAALVRQHSEALEDPWTRALSVGADYTFGIGNGLTVLTEHLDRESPTFAAPPGSDGPEVLDSMPQGQPSPSDASPDMRLTSFTANYPLGVLDRIAIAVYRDWEGESWLRLVEWRRTYDRWRLHLLGFWNPAQGALLPTTVSGGAARSGTLAGSGFQLIVVFNH